MVLGGETCILSAPSGLGTQTYWDGQHCAHGYLKESSTESQRHPNLCCHNEIVEPG